MTLHVRARLVAAAVLGTVLACGGGGGGGGNGTFTDPGHQPSAEQATRLSGIGDSMMQGANVTAFGDRPEFSFAQGTSHGVFSLRSRYQVVSGLPAGEEFESHDGDTMVADAHGQAVAICEVASKPDRIVILLGANDACAQHTVEDFTVALEGVLELLGSTADCGLPSGTRVHVLSVPRVDHLFDAVSGKSCSFDGPSAFCPIVTGPPADREQVGSLVDGYNQAIGDAVAAANAAFHHADGDILFSTDWVDATPDTSIGTHAFAAADISSLDCFHPSTQGQAKLACAAWESWEGVNDPATCF